MSAWTSCQASLLVGLVNLSIAVAGFGQSPRTGLIKLTDRAWAWIATNDASSNSAVFVGNESALIADPGLTPSVVDELWSAVKEVTDKPVKWVVLTHWHPDHSLGVTCSTSDAFKVVAHPESRRMINEHLPALAQQYAQSVESESDRKVLSSGPVRLPEVLVPGSLTIDLGEHPIEILHPGGAHTQGDLAVWSPLEKVLVTGDLFLRDAAPYMGEGDTQVWIDVLTELSTRKPAYIIPGHFALSGSRDMLRFRDYLRALVRQAGSALAQGSRIETAAEAAAFPEFSDFQQYPQYAATFRDNAWVVLNELAKAQQDISEEQSRMQTQISREIEGLHRFFEEWFTGRLPRTRDAFSRFEKVMAEEFEIVSPEGRSTRREALIERLWQAHRIHDGSYRIWIEKIRYRQIATDMFLVTYKEWQHVKGKARGRLSTAVLRRPTGEGGGLDWLHVHETWLPE